jgi:hypothetical protein
MEKMKKKRNILSSEKFDLENTIFQKQTKGNKRMDQRTRVKE